MFLRHKIIFIIYLLHSKMSKVRGKVWVLRFSPVSPLKPHISGWALLWNERTNYATKRTAQHGTIPSGFARSLSITIAPSPQSSSNESATTNADTQTDTHVINVDMTISNVNISDSRLGHRRPTCSLSAHQTAD